MGNEDLYFDSRSRLIPNSHEWGTDIDDILEPRGNDSIEEEENDESSNVHMVKSTLVVTAILKRQ